jgi:hypothetical protein
MGADIAFAEEGIKGLHSFLTGIHARRASACAEGDTVGLAYRQHAFGYQLVFGVPALDVLAG